jgi:hypothetical protein
MGKAAVKAAQAIPEKTMCFEHAVRDWCLARLRTPMMASGTGKSRRTGRT